MKPFVYKWHHMCCLCNLLFVEGTMVPQVFPSTGAAAFEKNTTFTCVFNGSFQQWDLSIPTMSELALSAGGNSALSNFLKSHGFSIGSDPAVLHVRGSSSNNGTKVGCTVIAEGSAIRSETLPILVFTAPVAPRPRAVSVGAGLLLLLWEAVDPPASVVNVSYTIITVNVNETTERESRVGPLPNTWHLFEYSASCQLVRFSVVAENEAGKSAPSEPLVVTIPVTPRFNGEVKATVQLSTNVTIYFMFKAATTCNDLPVLGYHLRLYNDTSLSTDSLVSEADSYNLTDSGKGVEFTANHLKGVVKNAKYSFIITAFNSIGNGSTAPQIVYTTDVQSSTVSFQGHTIYITCYFAAGSRAKGCAVNVEKEGSVRQTLVPRKNNSAESSAVIVTDLAANLYTVTVVDWEEDGSFGSLNVPVIRQSIENIDRSVTQGQSTADKEKIPLLVVIASSVLGGVLLTAVASLTIITLVCWSRSRIKKQTSDYKHHAITTS